MKLQTTMWTMVILAFAALHTVPASVVRDAGRRWLTKRVVGGEMAARGEAKFSASLWYKKPNPFTANTGLGHVCGGTLIAKRWVLTSAHCFDDVVFEGLSNLADWEVVLGENHQNITEEGEQKFTIDKIYVSPEYNLSVPTGDVALLYLSGEARTDEYTDVIELDEDTDCAVEGATCVVYGWGQEKENPYGYGTVLQYKADVTVWDNQKCHEAFAPLGYFTITENELCANAEGQDACYGDSGGPLICTCDDGPVLSGIVFTGEGCARAEYPGIYERVTQFVDWINSVMDSDNDDDDDQGESEDNEA